MPDNETLRHRRLGFVRATTHPHAASSRMVGVLPVAFLRRPCARRDPGPARARNERWLLSRCERACGWAVARVKMLWTPPTPRLSPEKGGLASDGIKCQSGVLTNHLRRRPHVNITTYGVDIAKSVF